MSKKLRTQVNLSEEVVRQLDGVVGARKRSEFLERPAVARGPARLEDAQDALRTFEAFNLPERAISSEEILQTAHDLTRSAYDAAYLALALSERAPLVTADKRLYNAVKDRSQAVLWVEDFR